LTAPAPPWSETAGAIAAMDAVVRMLRDAGVDATADPGAFYPAPAGVLVTLPTLLSRSLAANSYSVPVLVVAADPLNEELQVKRLLALADDVARVIRTDQFRPGSYAGGPNAQPVPAIEMETTVTLGEIGGLDL
jgi:hypothetical protein